MTTITHRDGTLLALALVLIVSGIAATQTGEQLGIAAVVLGAAFLAGSLYRPLRDRLDQR